MTKRFRLKTVHTFEWPLTFTPSSTLSNLHWRLCHPAYEDLLRDHWTYSSNKEIHAPLLKIERYHSNISLIHNTGSLSKPAWTGQLSGVWISAHRFWRPFSQHSLDTCWTWGVFASYHLKVNAENGNECRDFNAIYWLEELDIRSCMMGYFWMCGSASKEIAERIVPEVLGHS